MNTNNLTNLPDEMLLNIMDYLTPLTIIRLIDNRLIDNRITKHGYYWYNRLYREIPKLKRFTTPDWYQLYRNVYKRILSTRPDNIIEIGINYNSFIIYSYGISRIIMHEIEYIDYKTFGSKALDLVNGINIYLNYDKLAKELINNKEYNLLVDLLIYYRHDEILLNMYVPDVGIYLYLNNKDLFWKLINNIYDTRPLSLMFNCGMLDYISADDLDRLFTSHKNLIDDIWIRIIISSSVDRLISVIIKHYRDIELIILLLLKYNRYDIVEKYSDILGISIYRY